MSGQHLPESAAHRSTLGSARRADTAYDRALDQLKRLADKLDHNHPGAAGSLREGMQETPADHFICLG
jgi:putative transposase